MVSKNLLKFQKRLKDELNIDVDITTFRRMYPGHWQRMEGAVSWVIKINDPSRHTLVASNWTIKDLLKAKKIIDWNNYGDTFIDIDFGDSDV